jgi:hypothetical protein
LRYGAYPTTRTGTGGAIVPGYTLPSGFPKVFDDGGVGTAVTMVMTVPANSTVTANTITVPVEIEISTYIAPANPDNSAILNHLIEISGDDFLGTTIIPVKLAGSSGSYGDSVWLKARKYATNKYGIKENLKFDVTGMIIGAGVYISCAPQTVSTSSYTGATETTTLT